MRLHDTEKKVGFGPPKFSYGESNFLLSRKILADYRRYLSTSGTQTPAAFGIFVT
jgi:hypothetical protein